MNKELILSRIKESNNLSSDKELADFLGISKSTLSNWYKRNSIDYDLVFSKCEQISKNWLLTGEGSMSKEKMGYYEEESFNAASEPKASIYRLKTDYFGVDKQIIPLYELEAAAGLDTLFSNQNTQIPLDYISVPNAPKCDGALFVRGDSMYPVLKAGDIVCFKIINEFQDVRPGEMYVLDIEDNSDRYLTVKYIQRSDISDEYFKLVSQNANHQPKEEHKSHIKALAIVKVSIRYNTIS
ncbi:MAG: S24 family peptidase [Dysgonomonas sp.]